VDRDGNAPEHPNQRWYHPTTGRLVQKGLTQVAKIWPTPTAQDAKNDGGPSQWERNSDPLNVAVKKWPTPDASQRGARKLDLVESDSTVRRRGAGQVRGIDLETAAQRFPTPTAGDASRAGNRNNPHSKAHAGVSLTDAALTGDSSTPRSAVTGSLNPQWVEWLMGYPSGWTDLKG
jgi:hypothetical protein